jgi:hypothetical protein
VLFVLLGVIGIIGPMSRSEPEEAFWGVVLLGLGVLALLFWRVERRQPGRPTYSVTLTSASGEQVAYVSPDEALVRELVACLNEAIAARD